MIKWLRKVLRRENIIVVTPTPIPQGCRLVYQVNQYVGPDEIVLIRETFNQLGLPDALIIVTQGHAAWVETVKLDGAK